MNVAIYIRPSNEGHQRVSLDEQIEDVRRFCVSRGLSVADEHIFVESALSCDEMAVEK
jgi:hypothetical protein